VSTIQHQHIAQYEPPEIAAFNDHEFSGLAAPTKDWLLDRLQGENDNSFMPDSPSAFSIISGSTLIDPLWDSEKWLDLEPPDSITESKTDQSWSLPPITDVSLSPTPPTASPSPISSLVERPPRIRGKLPKLVTDVLKEWLHNHSDHPYPSEEEKKALCLTTGLTMSQVSNLMINVCIRI
jgi:hypothetical protein